MKAVCPRGSLDQFIGNIHARHLPVPFLLAGRLSTPIALAAGIDSRVAVDMPAMMQDHMRAINDIQSLLAAGKYDAAADIAENRIGMSSLETHGASHMSGFLPKGMQETGTAMHQAASRFAAAAQEAGVTRDLPRALAALSQITTQCVACHAGYRLN